MRKSKIDRAEKFAALDQRVIMAEKQSSGNELIPINTIAGADDISRAQASAEPMHHRQRATSATAL